MSVTDKEFLLLLELQRDPLISYKKLAKKLNVSATTVKNIVQKLTNEESKSRGVKGKRTPLGFYAIYNLQLLGLTRVFFFVECRNKDQTKLVEKFCDEHPYTSFLARIYGGKNGYLLIFNIPPPITEYLHDAIKFLINNNIIESYEMLVDHPVVNISSMPDVEKFNIESLNWNFNIEKFSKKLNDMPITIPEKYNYNDNGTNLLNSLNLFDIALLREWMTGAGPRKLKSDILDSFENDPAYDLVKQQYPITRQYLDERYKILHSNGPNHTCLIETYGIRYNRVKLLLQNQFLFTGTANYQFLLKLANSLNQNLFPFASIFTFTKANEANLSSFFWWITTPPKESAEITEWLYKVTDHLKTYIVTNNPEYVISYPLYHNNFISKSQESGGLWNMNYDYCVTEVINSFNESIISKI